MPSIAEPLISREDRREIESQLNKRVADHRDRIAAARVAGVFSKPNPPLVLLADGDSWFDYPLDGVLLKNTDMLAQLPSVAVQHPFIMNFAHHGDATTASLGVKRQERLIDAIKNQIDPLFDAILFSGGGDDIVGDQLCIWLNDASSVGNNPALGLNAAAFAAIMRVIEESYSDLLALRDQYLPGKPIFTHDYDFAYPSGIGLACIGPWLQPSLNFRHWQTPNPGREIVTNALLHFREFIRGLAHDPSKKFVLVETQGTLTTEADWTNELHPNAAGFKQIATRLRNALAAAFPGRI